MAGQPARDFVIHQSNGISPIRTNFGQFSMIDAMPLKSHVVRLFLKRKWQNFCELGVYAKLRGAEKLITFALAACSDGIQCQVGSCIVGLAR